MTKKNEKACIAELKNGAKVSVSHFYINSNKELDVEVKHAINFEDMLQFINNVVDSCFDDDGAYLPEVKDFCIRVETIEKYTNLNLTVKIEEQYDILYGSDFYDGICRLINVDQYDSIICAINEKIDHKLSIIESSAVNKVNELLDKINTVAEEAESVFGGITSDELSDIMKNLFSLNNITEESLAKAVLSAKKDVEQKDKNLVSVRK